MGNYRSVFKDNGGRTASDTTHPSKNNWITIHAAATGLAVVEVERLWTRFQQLGCSKDGILEAAVLTRPPASQDIFFKNVLVTFRSADGTIAFQTFCNAMKWAETSSVETKMKAIFNMLNNGQPVSRDILLRVLKRVYPTEDPEVLESTADSFIEQMDDVNSGVITQSQWVEWSRKMPQDQMEALLEFSIIPPDINMEAHRAFTSQAYSSLNNNGIAPTDAELSAVAKKVKKYDWAVLANRLDFTQSDVSQLQARYRGDVVEQVYQLLKKWRTRDGKNATKSSLENTLRQCGMNDAAMPLYP